VERAKDLSNGAVFVDAFYPRSASRHIVTFVNNYQMEFGEIPSATEAFAYDAASLLDRTLLVSGESPSRQDVRNLLREVREFPGVTGKISFRDGEFYRELKVLTFQDGRISEIN